MEDIAHRLARLRRELDAACHAAGRNASDVTLVAVSKTHPADAIAQAHAAGQLAFGESYAQEAAAKQRDLAHLPLVWHFIGHIQSRKARELAGRYALIHAVDSAKVASILHANALERGLPQPILLQVNVGREPQKHGLDEADLPETAERILALETPGGGVRLEGLMCLPPWSEDAEASRPHFARLRELRDMLRARLGRPLPHLSMGMSHDFPQAIAEGATLVRVGTAIFGQRDCPVRVSGQGQNLGQG